jgi:CHAT domain-containing protein/FHA domain-containing protein
VQCSRPWCGNTSTRSSVVASGRDLLRDWGEERPTVDLFLVANPAFDDRPALSPEGMDEGALRATDYRGQFTRLPGMAQEARVIPPLLKGTQRILEGSQATESTVRAVQSPKVLGFITHGFFLKDQEGALADLFAPAATSDLRAFRQLGDSLDSSLSCGRGRPALPLNPLVRSGLALAGANHALEVTTGDDGLLTALEISGMNLSGTELVVLSACETGAGEIKVGEGVYGLRRAFVLAGARTLVMSLWAVSDKLTVTQMEEFYRAYGRGETAVQALRHAQVQTIARLRQQTQTALGVPLAPVTLWAPFLIQQTGEHTRGPQTQAAAMKYGWWNLAVLLLAAGSLLLLSRVQLNGVRPEGRGQGFPPGAPQPQGPTSSRWAQGLLPARLLRVSAIEAIPPEIVLVGGSVLLGAGPECDVVLSHPSVAPQHARVFLHPQGYILQDLGSATGSHVNGRRIRENLLKDGWTVQLGEVEFVFSAAKDSWEGRTGS